jgi:serine/threonine protein kinase
VTPERWQQVTAVFERALACASDERAAALEEACAGDRELFEEVESLLATYFEAGDSSLDQNPIPAAVREAMEAFEPLAGKQVGPYAVGGLLGRGGMGEVYRARDARLGRDVAIKVLHVTYSGDADRLRRFEQEARAAGMLNHPNVLAVYDVGTHDGSPFIVSELLEGETLGARLAAGPLPVREALGYAAQVARGLTAAHAKGIVHRDLKPENLFLTRDGRVKILDFGVAKLLAPDGLDGRAASLRTASGVVVGTAAYMSPEQAQGQRVDQRSDVFSFGSILYEMLAGERAFERVSAGATMSAIVEDAAPSLAEAGVSAPAALEAALRRCLEKSPAERFQSASDLAAALERIATPASEAPAAPHWRPAVVIASVASVVIAAGVAAVWYVGKRVYDAGVRAGRASVE